MVKLFAFTMIELTKQLTRMEEIISKTIGLKYLSPNKPKKRTF